MADVRFKIETQLDEELIKAKDDEIKRIKEDRE